jgi:hypothetical protein
MRDIVRQVILLVSVIYIGETEIDCGFKVGIITFIR